MMMLIFMFSFSTVLSCIIVFILMIQWLPSSHIKYVKINNTKHSKINIKINISLFEHRVPPYLHGSKPHVSSQIHQFGGVIRHIQRHQSSDCWQVISHNHYIYIYIYYDIYYIILLSIIPHYVVLFLASHGCWWNPPPMFGYVWIIATAEEREQKQLSVIMDRGSAENAVTICVSTLFTIYVTYLYRLYLCIFHLMHCIIFFR